MSTAAPRDPVSPSAEVGLLDALPAAARAAVLAAGIERAYAADEVLFTAGSPARGLFLVLEGRVRVLRAGGTRPFVVHVEGPGGTLGEVPLFERLASDAAGDPLGGAGGTRSAQVGCYPATAVAAEPTRCLVIPPAAVAAAVCAHPQAGLFLLSRLARRVRHLVERMDRRAGLPVQRRLAELLLAKHRAAGGRSFVPARTQQEAAEELGTVREVVVRGLRALRRAGVVRAAGGGRYVVLDEPALRRAAGRDA